MSEAMPLPLPQKVVDIVESYTWFDTMREAANAWSAENIGLSEKLERCAFIYKNIDEKGNERYTIGQTKQGMEGIPTLNIRDNVVIPFVSLYLGEKILASERVGFIHSHPAPSEGYTTAMTSNEDLFLLNLPGIDAVYVVPYEYLESERSEYWIVYE